MLAFNTSLFLYAHVSTCIERLCVGLNAYDSITITVRHFVNIICIDCSDQKRSFVSLTSIIITVDLYFNYLYIYKIVLYFFIITNQFQPVTYSVCFKCSVKVIRTPFIWKCHRSRTVNKPSGKLHDAGVLPTPEVC